MGVLSLLQHMCAMFPGLADASNTLQWQYSMQQQVLGTAKVSAASILDSCGRPDEQTADGIAEFMAAAPLLSPVTGTLMLLKDASAKLQSVGSCRYRLVLHYSSQQQQDPLGANVG